MQHRPRFFHLGYAPSLARKGKTMLEKLARYKHSSLFGLFVGATTLSITTLGIITLRITTFSITTFSITTLSITALHTKCCVIYADCRLC